MNVAITRAKRKLLIVGDASTISSNSVFKKLVDACKGNGWIHDVPDRADLLKI